MKNDETIISRWDTLVVLFAILSWTFDFRLLGFSATSEVIADIRWLTVGLSGATGLLALTRKNPVRGGWPVWTFILSIAATVPFSADYERSLTELARVLSAAGLFVATQRSTDAESRGLFRGVIWVSVLIVIGTTIVLLSGNNNIVPYRLHGELYNRLLGLTWAPGLLGYFSAFVIGFAAMGLLAASSVWARLMYGALGLASLTCLILSGSRAGWAAVAIIVLGLFYAHRGGRRVTEDPKLGWKVGLLVTASCATALFVPVWLGLSGQTLTASTDDDRLLSIYERFNVWQASMEQFANSPIFGHGFGVGIMFRDEAADVVNIFGYSHSAIPNYLAATGVVGAFGVTVLILGIAYKAVSSLNSARRTHTQELAAIMILTTLPFAIVEGALQGLYQTYICFFISYGVLLRADGVTSLQAPGHATPEATVQNKIS